MTESEGAPGISRRRVVQGVAWATPAVVLAVATPASAASVTALQSAPLVASGSFGAVSGVATSNSQYRTNGWLPLSDDPGHANQDWGLTPGLNDGFLCMDDNASATEPVVVACTFEFAAVVGVTYVISYDMRTGFGNHDYWLSARESVVLTASMPGGQTRELDRATVQHDVDGTHPDAPYLGTSDADMVAQGYTLVRRYADGNTRHVNVSYNAGATGNVTLTFTFTIEPARASTVGDDIVVTRPRVVTQV